MSFSPHSHRCDSQFFLLILPCLKAILIVFFLSSFSVYLRTVLAAPLILFVWTNSEHVASRAPELALEHDAWEIFTVQIKDQDKSCERQLQTHIFYLLLEQNLLG